TNGNTLSLHDALPISISMDPPSVMSTAQTEPAAATDARLEPAIRNFLIYPISDPEHVLPRAPEFSRKNIKVVA
ncbi:hypothetical protein, partial [Thalassolituus sp.]|uniref:hypothetical protein n=1 Tax=Thalassolituus sp. TaxID=2030822 RepID=UPI003559CEB6